MYFSADATRKHVWWLQITATGHAYGTHVSRANAFVAVPFYEQSAILLFPFTFGVQG